MKRLLTLGVAAVLIACACAVHAYPTLAGPTGLILVPTGFVTCPGELDLAVDYDSGKGSADYSRTVLIVNDPDFLDQGFAHVSGKSTWPLRATYGVAQSFEVGVAYDVDAIFGKGLWDINAKYQLPVNWLNSAFAIGALYGESGDRTVDFFDVDNNLIDTESHKLDTTNVYLAGTHNFCLGNIPLGVTLGVSWAELNFINNNNGWRGQIGGDATLTKKLDIVADWQTRAKGDFQDLWSAGLRYYSFAPGFSAELGITNGPFIGTKATGVLLGVNYAWNVGGCATTTTHPGGYGY